MAPQQLSKGSTHGSFINTSGKPGDGAVGGCGGDGATGRRGGGGEGTDQLGHSHEDLLLSSHTM
jgi:hypothetical protein